MERQPSTILLLTTRMLTEAHQIRVKSGTKQQPCKTYIQHKRTFSRNRSVRRVDQKTYLVLKSTAAEGNGDPVSDFKLQRPAKKIQLVKDLVDEEGSWGGFDEGGEQ